MSATLCSCVCFLLLTCADGATCPRDIFAAGPEKDETSLLQVASHVKRKGQKDQVRHADVADSETKEVVDEEDLDKRAEAMTQIFTGIASSVKSRCNDWFANLRKRAQKGETMTGWIAGLLLDFLIVWPLGTAIRKNMWNYCDAYSQSQLFALPSLIGLSAWILSDSLQDGTFGVYMAWYWAVLICTVLGCAAQLINYQFPYPRGALCELSWETWSRESYEQGMRDAGQTVPYEVQADEQSKPKAGGQVPAQA